MKKLLCASIFVFAFCIASFSQINQNTACPTIDVLGPAGVPQAGDKIYFTADVKEIESANLTYNWAITTGEILQGQGTSVIEVQLPKKWEKAFVASVEIKEFPKGCQNTDSETIPCGYIVEAKKIGEFSLSETRIDKAKLDYLIVQLQKDPTSQAYIIEKFSKNTSQKIISQKTQKIRNYLFNIRQQDKNRFTIVIDLADENLTQFWIVPAGAILPPPDD